MPCNPGAHPSCRHASPPCSPCTHACRAARLSPDNLAAVSAHQHIHVRIGLHLPLMQSRRPPPQAGRLLSFLDSVLCCPLISPPKAALAVTAAADILAHRWRPTACFLDTVSIAVVLHGLLFRFLRHQVLAFVDTGEISYMLYSRLRSTSAPRRPRSTANEAHMLVPALASVLCKHMPKLWYRSKLPAPSLLQHQPCMRQDQI
jgi:hypothetical protein